MRYISGCGFLGLLTVGGCGVPVAAVVIKVLMFVGSALITSGIGYTVEIALDNLFAQEQVISSSIKDVRISDTSPLEGVVTHPLKVALNDTGAAIVLEHAKVTRSSISSSDWKIDQTLMLEVRSWGRRFDK